MNTFAFASVGLWAVSSGLWVWAACVNPPILPHPKGNDGAIILGDEQEEGSFFGAQIPSYSTQIVYYKKTTLRNTLAAGVSAAASAAAALAICFPNI